MIVYTRGRVPNSDQDYRATEDSEFTDIPIVVLANRNSASASEIVTGALQDHDRAYIVGETTFGKALVQSVYRISGGAGLALTTAHYYTPSGRLIQRPWDATFDEYLSYTLRDQDANKPHNPSDLKHTDAGRPVYSGGGIEPDKRVAGPLEGFNPGRFGRMLVRARRVRELRAEVHGRRRHAHRAARRPAARLVKPNFVVDDAMVADFREQLKTDSVKIDEDGVREGSRVHQGDDPLRDRRGGVRHRRRAASPDRGRSAGAGRADDVRRGAEADRAQQGRKIKATTEVVAVDGPGWGKRPQSIGVAVCSCPYS